MMKKKLEGSLTLEQRVEIAQDIIARLESRQRKLAPQHGIFLRLTFKAKVGEQFNSEAITSCQACMKGAWFLASVDRRNECSIEDVNESSNSRIVNGRLREELGEQGDLMEACFEGYDGSAKTVNGRWFDGARRYRNFHSMGRRRPRAVMLAIARNLVANGGLFRPELELEAADAHH